ncbi:MAG: M28 family metallopeptidase [Cryomorphaceae bacterium]|nr:M28 family metallopeptidase [Cryomorphaceae bacterium]
MFGYINSWMNEQSTLLHFLNLPLYRTDEVFEMFDQDGAVFQSHPADPKQRFLFIEGKRNDKVVLVAHADTVWDEAYTGKKTNQQVNLKNGIFTGTNKSVGIGADDRAGCAMLYLLKNSGHSILITDGEEYGRGGSTYLMNHHPDIASKLNAHKFMIQLDRRNAHDFKCYTVGSNAFRKYIQQQTGYTEPDQSSYTDIVTLCKDICGVNFSVGYYYEHFSKEHLVLKEWMHTYNMVKELIGQAEIQRFPLTTY